MNKEAERKRLWKIANKERERENNKRWYEANRDLVARRKADYYLNNAENEKLRSKIFRKLHPKKRRPKNPQERVIANIRSKVSHIIAGRYKKSRTEKYIGCSFEELKKHLESQFLPEMTWDNYGQYGWHVDHIIPLKAFDLSMESNLYKAWHYSNLQPLWWRDNIRKGKKINVDKG